MANSVINTLKIDNTEYDLGIKTLDNIAGGILQIGKGGTGASTAANARTNLDVFSKSEVNSKITPITEKNTAQDTQISANTTAISNEAARAKEVETGHNNRTTVLETQIVGLSGAMHFKGVEDSLPTNLTNYDIGDVVIVGNKEYVVKENASGNKEWVEFGDVTVVSQNLTNLTNKVNGLKYAGSSTAGGSATSAVKLDSNAGSATQPIYFSGGIPVATTYSLGANVPSDAKFTDTNTKVTSVGNHYTPSANNEKTLSADASSTTAATWNSTSLVTGVNLQRDAAGHVTGVTVDSIKMPANPDTGATSIEVTGTGNAITSASYDSSTRKITLTKGATYNNYSLPTASSSTLGGVKIGSNINISSGTISVPSASGTAAGVTIVYPAASCTTFSSDTGTASPLAIQKGAKMFAITRPPKKSSTDPYPGTDTSVTVNALLRWEDADGNVKNSKITVEDVTNTRDTSKKANVLIIPAEDNKKMVYGYCTDQIDGTSFIGGVFDNSATEYPYSAGLAIGGTSGNLLWKGNRVIDASVLSNGTSTAGVIKTTSTVTSNSGYTACPVINGVPYYKDTNNTYTLSSFNITATAAELNVLDGITATTTELNYCDGVTSSIQTQLNGKAASSHTHGNITNSGTITSTAVTSATGLLVYDSNNKIQRATAANVRSIIGAGTSNLAIGTTATTAAAGNHSHSHNHPGETVKPICIEFQPTSSAGHGGYLDFHYNNSTADYTSRIIESASGRLSFLASNGIVLDSGTYGTTLPTSGLVAGRIFFKKA